MTASGTFSHREDLLALAMNRHRLTILQLGAIAFHERNLPVVPNENDCGHAGPIPASIRVSTSIRPTEPCIAEAKWGDLGGIGHVQCTVNWWRRTVVSRYLHSSAYERSCIIRSTSSSSFSLFCDHSASVEAIRFSPL